MNSKTLDATRLHIRNEYTFQAKLDLADWLQNEIFSTSGNGAGLGITPAHVDYCEKFNSTIMKADLNNGEVVNNLDNALVMVSAMYDHHTCTNIDCLRKSGGRWEVNENTFWDFYNYKYRLKPKPQYKPFDYETIKPRLGEFITDKERGHFYSFVVANANGVYLSKRAADYTRFYSYQELLDKFNFGVKI